MGPEWCSIASVVLYWHDMRYGLDFTHYRGIV